MASSVTPVPWQPRYIITPSMASGLMQAEAARAVPVCASGSLVTARPVSGGMREAPRQ